MMGSMGNGDRISSFPDNVLCHILSFLPTKYSVRTRVLCTRWKHLFTFVPNLDLEFFLPHQILGSRNSFIDFVNSVFVLYNVSRMNKFTLKLNYQPDNSSFCWWISSVILRHVQEIHIHTIGRLTMPLDLDSCKTLTSLKLQAGYINFVLPGSESVCLPCLRTCVLQGVCFDDESAKSLFRCCPALEDLDMHECSLAEGVRLLDISSRTLKHLSIDEYDNEYQLVLDVPNLLSFEYVGTAMLEFLGLESLKTVVDAWIYSHGAKYNRTKLYSRDGVVVKLVRAFSHVQKLTISCETIEAFIRYGHSLPKFDKLTSLMYIPISSRSWMLLPSFLDNSPRLEYLSIYLGDDEDDIEDDPDNYIFPECAPPCVALHLKEVEFRYYFTLDYHRKLVNYFLKYAKNLKKMKITSNLSWDEQLNDQFEISSA